MKRRKGKTRKPAGRTRPIRLLIERLETRQLLAGFVSIAVPGAVETGTVNFIESAAHINVKVAEPVCNSKETTKADGKDSADCNFYSELRSTFGNTLSSRMLSVGDGFGLSAPSFDGAGNDTLTSNPTTVGVAVDPKPSTPDPITIITEDPVVDANPVDQSPQPAPDVGVYFTDRDPLTGDQSGDSATASTSTTSTTSQPRIAALSRVQMFSLVSPSDIPRAGLPSLDQPTVANPLPNPFTPANTQVDSMFEGLDDELDFVPAESEGIQPTHDVSDLNFEKPNTGLPESQEPTNLTSPITEPGLDQLSSPTLGVLPTVPLNVLEDVLQSMIVEDSDPEEESVADTPAAKAPVNPDLPANETDDEELVDGIYLVEGIILITALPSSLVRRRDDEPEDKFSV